MRRLHPFGDSPSSFASRHSSSKLGSALAAHSVLCLLFSYFFHSLFKLEQTVLLVTLGSAAWLVQELLRHVRVWMMRVEALDLWSLARARTPETPD
jgi:hypothetical protein